MHRFTSVLALLITMVAGSAFAEEIVTDRPDAAESSLTVGARNVQIESGIDATFAGSTSVYAFPTKLRVGLIDRLEFHLESGVWEFSSAEVAGERVSSNGVSPLDVGGKVNFFEGATSMGALFALTIPLDEAHAWSAKGLLATDFSLTETLGLGTNVGVAIPLSDGGLVTGLYAVALGIGVPPLPGLGFFVEVFGGVNEEAFYMLTDGGLTYLITPTLQVDAYARTGLVNDETDAGFGAGVSARF